MMWRSVPQTPQAPTRTTTSFGPASGSGTSSTRVSPGSWTTTAFIFDLQPGESLLGDGDYFTAPIERPRTSWRWEIQPRMTTGAIAIVLAAESLAQNNPSDVMNFCMKSGTVAALSVATRLTAKKNSFQAKIIERNAVAAIPGPTIGSRIWTISRI